MSTESTARKTTRATRRRWRSCSGSGSVRYEGRGSSIEDAIGGAGYPGPGSALRGVRVEPRLQDDLGGGSVDHAPASPAVDAGVPQRALRLDRRQPLVVEGDRDGEDRAERLREVRSVHRAVTPQAIQRDRLTDHDERNVVLTHEVGDGAHLPRRAADLNGAERQREPALRIADRDADPDVADIEAEDAAGGGAIRHR